MGLPGSTGAVEVHGDPCGAGLMIVRQFLHWLRHAPPGERAEATSALARAYLYSDLSENDRAAAEGAIGLGLLIALYRNLREVGTAQLNQMKQ